MQHDTFDGLGDQRGPVYLQSELTSNGVDNDRFQNFNSPAYAGCDGSVLGQRLLVRLSPGTFYVGIKI